jgi:protein CpxP
MITILALAFGVFAGAAAAQDTTSTQKTDNGQAPRGGKFGRDGAGPGFRGGPGGPMGFMREFRNLNLTDDQKQQIHTILESNKPDKTSMDQMRTLMDARRNNTLTDDQKAQLKALREQQDAKMKSVHDQIFNVLTPDQKAQLEKERQDMRQKWQQRQSSPKTTTPPSETPTNN